MKKDSRIRIVSSALALGVAALCLSANAQTSDSSMKAEPAKGNGPVQRAEDATKRGAKKAGHAISHGAHKTHDAVEHTGEKIGSKLPPNPHPADPNTPTTTNQ